MSAVVYSDECDDSDDTSIDKSSGDSQLVTQYNSHSVSLSSSFHSNNHSNNNKSTPATCSCTNTLFHLFCCSVPFSRRTSLHFITPSSVLPRNQYAFNVESIMSQRVTSLSNASHAQMQLINVGINMSRATCSLKPDVWSSLLVEYVPSDSCYTSEVLVAGMKYGSYTRYEGDRTESVSKRNHPDARKHPHELLQLVLQELSLGRVIGPFSLQSPPFEHIKICVTKSLLSYYI